MKNENSIVEVNKNGFMYKIKQFIYNIFHKKEVQKEEAEEVKAPILNTSQDNFKNRLVINQDNHIGKLALQIQEGKANPEDFSEQELDEIIEYFENSIEQKENKLKEIRNRIIKLKQDIN